MRNWFVFLFLAFLIVISFLLWGDSFTAFFEEGRAVKILEEYGSISWLVGILILIGDLFLPLPATLIMSALGYLYGPVIGGLLSVIGNFLSGVVAYGICISLGERGALFILGQKDFDKGRTVFNARGGWIVALSRWLPIVPEVVACMAGLNRMDAGRFSIALLCGSLPLGFVFAWIGHSAKADPEIAIALSALLPAILWMGAQYLLRRLTQ